MPIADADLPTNSASSDLAAALSGLAAIEAGRSTLAAVLTEVSSFALRAIPGADGVGVTMLESSAPDTIVASAPFVHEVDEIQYRLGEGPCISAADAGLTTGSGALGEDAAWPRFGPMAAALGRSGGHRSCYRHHPGPLRHLGRRRVRTPADRQPARAHEAARRRCDPGR